jgi:hypothetical protein
VSRNVVLYERDGCHLCEEAGVVLDEMLGADGYRRVDIAADEELVLRYGFRIPVVAVDGIDRLEVPISRPELQALLGTLSEDR